MIYTFPLDSSAFRVAAAKRLDPDGMINAPVRSWIRRNTPWTIQQSCLASFTLIILRVREEIVMLLLTRDRLVIGPRS
jgi:hypothetical protein